MTRRDSGRKAQNGAGERTRQTPLHVSAQRAARQGAAQLLKTPQRRADSHVGLAAIGCLAFPTTGRTTPARAVHLHCHELARHRRRGRRAPRQPRAHAAHPAHPAARPSAARPRPSPPRAIAVIVATADPSLTRMLTFALDQARLPHVEFQSGHRGAARAAGHAGHRHPPILVLDVDLPGVDGHAILERLGVERPDAFLIVVLSSHADESVQVRSLLAGALDHLAKPFNVRVLMAKLLRWTTIAARCQAAA